MKQPLTEEDKKNLKRGGTLVTCPTCNGTGNDPLDCGYYCFTCQGKQQIVYFKTKKDSI